ncbi:MAG: transporter [Polaromonas sp.]|nr:transporter [Polaromonas sp.]
MSSQTLETARPLRAARYVIAAGVVAALHVGKLPPALPVLRDVLGISLLQAGFLLSLVQLAGMTLGLLTGLAAQRVGLKRSMVAGLLVLGCASALGGLANGAAWLLATRALEGLGFLWVVLPAPGLVRRLVPQERLNGMLGVWGAYMPLGASLALLLGPSVMQLGAPAWGWRIWWWGLGALAAMLALLLCWRLPADPSRRLTTAQAPEGSANFSNRSLLGLTLRSRGVWLMALTFAMYSGQWLAVIGFLPSIYAQAGLPGSSAAWLTAGAAAVNIVGNLAAGRWLGRGARPLALLATGFLAMAGGALLAFGATAHPLLQYAGVLVFSMIGGLIPATLFSLAIRLAPTPETVSTTVGWVQQWSALGQFAGPPLVAWVAVQAGGWQWTGWVTSVCCAIGLLLARELQRLAAQPPAVRLG